MSLINDALIKAERDRTEAMAADAAGLGPAARAEKRRELKKARSLGFIILNVTLLTLGFGVVILVLLRNQPPSSSGPALGETPSGSAPFAAASAPSVVTSVPAEAAAPTSPFQPPVASTEPFTQPALDYELAGMSAVGNQTLLSILRRRDQRSVWIPVGKSAGEITAVSYNPVTDRAVIRVDGRLLEIGLRTGPSPDTPPAAQAAE